MLRWLQKWWRRRKYEKYIKSPQWRKLREQVLERDKYECFVCGSEKQLEAHHLFYESNLYKGKPYQIITLCKRCHIKIHRKLAKKDII